MTSSNGNIFCVTGPLYKNSTVTGEFPWQRPVMRSFDGFFYLCLNKRFRKQSKRRWFETSSRSLWRCRSPVNSPHKGQWSGALMLSLICAWINGGVNNRDAGDLRRQRAHYDVNVMLIMDVIASTPFRDKLNTIIVQNGAMKCVSFINWYIHRRVLHTLDVAAEYGLTGHFRWRGPIEITWRDSVDMPSFPIYRKCLGVWFALKQIARGSKCPIEWCLRIDIGMEVS